LGGGLQYICASMATDAGEWGVRRILLGWVQNMPVSEGSDVSSRQEQRMIGNLILIINVTTLLWPIARKVLTGKHVEYYEKLVWCLGLPHSCYMKYCGGEKRAAARREQEKQARAERRRAAGVRRPGSMKHVEEVDVSLVVADLVLAKSSDRITDAVVCSPESKVRAADDPGVPRAVARVTNGQKGSTSGNSNESRMLTAGTTGAEAAVPL